MAVISGKGGVGKSLVTSLLAVTLARQGGKVGILDADITGPSIPKIFGAQAQVDTSEFGIFPAKSTGGIKIISVNLLLAEDDAPVIWRGPILSGMVKQFWTDVIWGDLDYLLLDMPPGTGDVPLTVFQTIPLDGVVIVTTPQDLVSLIVKKAYHMAAKMNIPILGIVENMSYLLCPDCGRRIEPFGPSHAPAVARELGVKLLGQLPINPELADLCDRGEIEKFDKEYLADAAQEIEGSLKK
ncbi:MAG: P-loop NTPase [Bacteroidota bacterium]